MSKLADMPFYRIHHSTNTTPMPLKKIILQNSANTTSTNMAAMRISINNCIFSKYECQIACAIKLFIRNANNQMPTDQTLGFVIKALRGEVNGEPLPCQDMVYQVEHYEAEAVRAIYLSVYCNRDYWYQEGKRVWLAWLAQNDALVQRLRAQGALAPFLNRDGSLKTR